MSSLAELAGDENSSERSKTFIFDNESHTLGNCLVFIINNYPEVMFCGYTTPHPSEVKLHLRIQTNGPRAVDILRRGLMDLDKMCDKIISKFKTAMTNYTERPKEEDQHL
uniref:DNA-directed RNA polymerases I and III subunit RPAC2 n=1 Tax=Clastoptera arizonana TaxID=38151 RepID=A0A1B6D0R6_9HEMI